MKKKNIALVLSGGGARGIAHIGAIEALEKEGYKITSISGTSMGALVGAVYALGKLDEFKKWIVSLDRAKIFSLLDFTISSAGLIKGEKVLNKMKEFINDANIEDLKIPYSAVGVDLKKRKEVVFTKGSIYDAIRVSIAIPSVFTPIVKNDSILVDGGVLNNVPINRVKRTDGDILVVVDVNANVEPLKLNTKKVPDKDMNNYEKKIENFKEHIRKALKHDKERVTHFNIISNTIYLMMESASQAMIKKHKPDILISISRDSCAVFDFFRSEELIEVGRISAMNAIKK